MTREDVLALIEGIAAWRAVDWKVRSHEWKCGVCGAAIGEPCRRGAWIAERPHSARQHRAAACGNSSCPNVWRSDLVDYGDPPARVLASIRRSGAYRHLLKSGRIIRTKGRDQWTEAQLSAAK
jgi:hypothetical protein